MYLKRGSEGDKCDFVRLHELKVEFKSSLNNTFKSFYFIGHLGVGIFHLNSRLMFSGLKKFSIWFWLLLIDDGPVGGHIFFNFYLLGLKGVFACYWLGFEAFKTTEKKTESIERLPVQVLGDWSTWNTDVLRRPNIWILFCLLKVSDHTHTRWRCLLGMRG